MTQDKALKIALDALETELSIDWTNNDEFNASAEKMYKAIAAIKEALAQEQEQECPNLKNCNGACFQCEYFNVETGEMEYPVAQPEQEPVADDFFRMIADRNPKLFSPPQRTWVGLTDDELLHIGVATGLERAAAQMIANKLKEKNT
jgi:hypothetical protein